MRNTAVFFLPFVGSEAFGVLGSTLCFHWTVLLFCVFSISQKYGKNNWQYVKSFKYFFVQEGEICVILQFTP